MQAKFLLVLALSAYQGWLARYGKGLSSGKRPLDNKTLRIMNELPGVAAAIIVVLVIVKPF
jgi:putative membrane protein